jgi:multisubunit Na+/H+ antiporter MnhF subunit
MVDTILLVMMAIVGVSLLLASVRLILGPGTPDRIVAAEVMLLHGVGLVALHVMRSGQVVALEITTGIALAVLLGMVALARYIEGEKLA